VIGSDETRSGTTTVGELVRAGALTVRAGQLPAEGSARGRQAVRNGLPMLTVSDLLGGGRPSGWLPRRMAVADLTVAAPDDVIVAG